MPESRVFTYLSGWQYIGNTIVNLRRPMARTKPVGANSFAPNRQIGDGANKFGANEFGANEFAPTMLRDIHGELVDQNREEENLIAQIQENPVGANSFAPRSPNQPPRSAHAP